MQICISSRSERLNLLGDKDMRKTSIGSRDGMWDEVELDGVQWERHISGTLNASEYCRPCRWGWGQLTCKCWNNIEHTFIPVVYWINGINVHMRWSIRSMYTDLSTNSHRRQSVRGGLTDLSMNAYRRGSVRGSHADLSTNAHRWGSGRGSHTDPSTNT